MGIREIITGKLPYIIPDFTYLDEFDQVQSRIYYGFIPEDEETLPAMAFLISEHGESRDLEGAVYACWSTVKFGIISKDVLELDVIKGRMLDLCGVGKLPGVRVIDYVEVADADPDLTLQNNLVGVEITLTFHM